MSSIYRRFIIICTIKATIQATTHCNITTPIALAPPSSLLTALIAATQGVYSKEKTKNTNAVAVVNRWEISPLGSNTIRVLTTLSLAVKPVNGYYIYKYVRLH